MYHYKEHYTFEDKMAIETIKEPITVMKPEGVNDDQILKEGPLTNIQSL